MLNRGWVVVGSMAVPHVLGVGLEGTLMDDLRALSPAQKQENWRMRRVIPEISLKLYLHHLRYYSFERKMPRSIIILLKIGRLRQANFIYKLDFALNTKITLKAN